MNLAPNSYNSNIVYLNGHKNPFDRQFELALKNRIHHSQQQQSATSTTTTFSLSSNENNNNNNNTYNPSSICCSSPLNTPLIQPDTAFNPAIGSDLGNVGGGDPTSTTITTAQITTLILESEIADDVNNNNNTNTNNNDRHCKETESNCCHQILHETPLSTSPSLNNNHSIVDNKTNDTLNDVQRYKQRSNAVSVICPPPYKDRGSEKIRSAPVILESANNIDDCSNGISNQNDDDDDDSIQQLMNKKRKRPLPATEIFNDFPAAKASTTQTTNIIPHHHITEKQLMPPPIPSSQSIQQQQQQSLSTDSLIDSIQSIQKMVTNTDDDNNFSFTSTFPSSIITQSSCPSTIATTTTKTIVYIDFWERINNHMILISQSDLPEFHLMKLKQDLERANRLKTNSKSQRMDQFQSPIIHFPHIKKIVREILNEIGTFLEVKNFETNDGLIFAIGDTWKIDHKNSDKFLNENQSSTEISQTSSLSVVPSPYEENEQIEVAIKASLQDHNNHDDNDDDCQIIANESMMEQQQPKNDNW
ncbi:hypothetical protein DERF_008939 [Dermatophagoides farinae]|uniref:Uncharacterized protein n=1 Tax=Dermatophagoides farinae TaxID=6954 RepID=A0A922HY27_DERFA|nr:hypothetical protein DERF_008939 [Dermatophagoides farinae]